MALARISPSAAPSRDAPEGIRTREAEYRRRADSLLRREYRSYFHGAGLSYGDREQLVCEVVDDVLVAEASGRVRADDPAARFSYLKVSLWRRLRTEWRTRQRRPVELADPHGALLECLAADADTAETALNRCALGLVAEALKEALDEGEREIARLFLIEQRTEREAASALGIGRTAACNRLEQVREKLRAHLAERGISCAEDAWCS